MKNIYKKQEKLMAVTKKEDMVLVSIGSLRIPGLKTIEDSELNSLFDDVEATDLDQLVKTIKDKQIIAKSIDVTRTNPDKTKTSLGIGDNGLFCSCDKADGMYKSNQPADQLDEEPYFLTYFLFCMACPYLNDNSCIVKQYFNALKD